MFFNEFCFTMCSNVRVRHYFCIHTLNSIHGPAINVSTAGFEHYEYFSDDCSCNLFYLCMCISRSFFSNFCVNFPWMCNIKHGWYFECNMARNLRTLSQLFRIFSRLFRLGKSTEVNGDSSLQGATEKYVYLCFLAPSQLTYSIYFLFCWYFSKTLK